MLTDINCDIWKIILQNFLLDSMLTRIIRMFLDDQSIMM